MIIGSKSVTSNPFILKMNQIYEVQKKLESAIYGKKVLPPQLKHCFQRNCLFEQE